MLNLAVDIGGTFTDLAYFDPSKRKFFFEKVLTTPDDPSKGVANAIGASRVSVENTSTFIHGTTVAINAVIERQGAKTALLTTRGFRDVIEIGRGNRPESYNIYFRRLEPIVPRELRFEVSERIRADGKVLEPPNLSECDQVIEALRANRIEALAICFINSYKNPEHETIVGAYIAERWPEGIISLSHKLSQEYREFERTSTAVINAYVSPKVQQYLDRIDKRILRPKFKGPFYVMQSNAGVETIEAAERKPVYMMESGPVAGVIGSAWIGKSVGHQNIVAFDMGGTTAKTCLVIDGQPPVTETYYIGGYGRGYPLQVPVLDMVEVGAGGGSIAWMDSVGAVQVGPRSAGADPGPACYSLGGSEPTVTDANLVLGRLNPKFFLGGRMALDQSAAERAIRDRLGALLGKSVAAIADGILQLANLTMAEAVRLVTVQRGLDPRDFIMVAYGGGGPLHSGAIARELSIPRVIIPPVPGNFSAIGMLLADIRRDFSLTLLGRLDADLLIRLEEEFKNLESSGEEEMRREVSDLDKVKFHRFADMRYVGQRHSAKVLLPGSLDGGDSLERVRGQFDMVYARQYGHSWPKQPVEITAIRIAVLGLRQGVDGAGLICESGRTKAEVKNEEREVFSSVVGKFVRCPVYERVNLKVGTVLRGPVIVEEPSSTTFADVDDTLEVDSHDYLIMQVGGKTCN